MSRANANALPSTVPAAELAACHPDNKIMSPAFRQKRATRTTSAATFLALFVARDRTFFELGQFVVDFIESGIDSQAMIV